MILRPYQIELAEKAANLLRTFGIAYLCMKVRTGKTLTALQAANEFGAKSVLFLTKLKAIASIRGDYELLSPGFRLYVTNYEQIEKLNPLDYDFIIIDEAQNFGKFPVPAKRTLQAKRIASGKPIIFLSGTPSPESYSQLFHQFCISSFNPWKAFELDKRVGFHQAFYRWVRAGYVTVTKKMVRGGLQVNDYSKAHPEKIWPEIKHLFIQFTQEEAGFSAPVEEHFLMVEMGESSRKIYRDLEKDKITTWTECGKEDRVATVNSGAELINKLCQISSGTLIYDEYPDGIVIDPAKAIFIKSRFHGQKIAILYKFKAEHRLLAMFFPNWTDNPELFNKRDDLVFLGQIQSSREGVNLATADALVMYNIDFSATSYFQAPARIQTKDRKGPANVYWIFSTHGIEQRVYNAVSNKKNFTYSYYKDNYARIENSKKNQAGAEEVRVAGDPANSY